MSRLLKLLLPLAVLLPLVGFVVGSLVTAAQDEPPPRTPIVLPEDSSDGPTDTARPTERTDDDHVVRPKPVEDDGDDDGGRDTDDRDDEAGDEGDDDRDDGDDDGDDDDGDDDGDDD